MVEANHGTRRRADGLSRNRLIASFEITGLDFALRWPVAGRLHDLVLLLLDLLHVHLIVLDQLTFLLAKIWPLLFKLEALVTLLNLIAVEVRCALRTAQIVKDSGCARRVLLHAPHLESLVCALLQELLVHVMT